MISEPCYMQAPGTLGPESEAIMFYTNPPKTCDICRCKIDKEFIDGKTHMGPWGNMCPPCHVYSGLGLGTGLGQRYVKQADGKFKKVQG